MFLIRLYKEWKALFWAVIIFIIVQGFFMYKAIETVPFFIYSMFSHAHHPKDSITVYLIKTPEGYFDHTQFSSREVEMLTNNIPYYNELKNNGYKDFVQSSVERRFKSFLSGKNYQYVAKSLLNDSTTVADYPGWWLHYFTTIANNKFDSVQVVKSSVSYSNGFAKSSFDSIIFSVKH